MSKVSIRKYAEIRGVSHTSVQKAIKTQRLARAVTKTADGKISIDTKIADLEWPKGERETMREAYSPKAAPAASKKLEDSESEEERKPSAAEKTASAYSSARAAREVHNAKITQLAYQEKAGQLVDAETVKKESFRVARIVRDAILNIPSRISAVLAHETDTFKVSEMLTAELRKALEGLNFDE